MRNPARSRPLSRNVRRLMKMEREAPRNPNVVKSSRAVTEMDIANCEMQGEIFMAAIDRGVDMDQFAPLYMTSQIASVIDFALSRSVGEEADEISSRLNIPLIMKEPDVFVDVVLWLDGVVSRLEGDTPLSLAVMEACENDEEEENITVAATTVTKSESPKSEIELIDSYEYAYWLGYIYRYECILHEETSRMVYGAFSETFMRKIYEEMMKEGDDSLTLTQCAGEICHRLDTLLIGKLWAEK